MVSVLGKAYITNNSNNGIISNNSTSTWVGGGLPIDKGFISGNSNAGNIFNNSIQDSIFNNRELFDIEGYSNDVKNIAYDIIGNNVSNSNIDTNTFEIDITGLTTISLAYKDIRYVTLISSNATETINDFSGFKTNRSIRFAPENGLTVTFVHGLGAGQPRCQGAANAVVNGTNQDWIIFEQVRDDITKQKNIGTY